VRSAAGIGDWSCRGVTGYVRGTPGTDTNPFYRYYNPSQARHYFTANFNELGNGRNGWDYRGVVAYFPADSATDTTGLHRYYNAVTNRVFHTANFAVLGNGGSRGWVYQGVVSQIWKRH
jgi:hypothetical protein